MSDNKTILCVDDEADILDLFNEEFEDCGFNVLTAGSGNIALKLIKNHDIDCIVSDIHMDDGDGVTLVKEVKALGKKIPIFLITGFSDYTADELTGLGVKAVIFKPFDLEEVVQMVSATVRK